MPPSKACIVRQGEGETPRVTGGLFRMIATGTTNGGAYVLAEYSTGPGVGAPPHRHKNEDEAFYVLEGRYLLQVDEQRYEIGAGDFAFFPMGRCMPSRVLPTYPHGSWSWSRPPAPSDSTARWVNSQIRHPSTA